MRRIARLAAPVALALAVSAHVGSPDAWFEGAAGPYPVTVHVEAPPVVPGIAVVNVQVEGPPPERVTAFANRFDATGGTPPPDVAAPVEDRPGWYRTRLWIMTQGSYGVTVDVSGAAGSGKVVVPLAAFPLRRLDFGSGLARGLIAAGLFLFAGLITIVGSAVREGVLPPGAAPDPARRRRARRAMAVGTVAVALVVLGVRQWWRVEDARFEDSLFRPLASAAELRDGRLALTIVDSAWSHDPGGGGPRRATEVRRGRLTTDHGKIMHMIVVDETGGRVLAHLHPTTADSVTFASPLPALPAGRYHVFGDIVEESGLAQTLVASIELPAPTAADPSEAAAGLDPDDAWRVREADSAPGTARLEDGSTLRWLGSGEPLRVGEEAPLRFVVERADSIRLEPYMGMAGHAMLVREGGGVFVHLHPSGTISMAAQAALSSDAARGEHAAHMAHMGTMPAAAQATRAAPLGDTISFPYAFPSPGRYHVWVQVKRAGKVLTGIFDADVQALP